jgi:D-sedoheptulose 7-phosphate isomerase
MTSASTPSSRSKSSISRDRERGLVTVALVGFEGGELKRLADHVLHVPVKNYGMVEDLHQATIHLITQYLTSLPPA